MNLKLVAASIALIGTSSVFAAPLDPQTVTVAPQNYIYIAGASAQSQALNAVARNLFDVPADVVQLRPAAPAPDAGDIQKHVGYLGVRNGQPTLIVYRNAGGSGSGLLQLIASSTSSGFPVSSGSVIKLPAGPVSGTAGNYSATATSAAVKLPTIALGDTRPEENTPTTLATADTAGYDGLGVLQPVIATGLQGFGVAVSQPLYNALIAANNAAGIPLVNGQPSIRRADYASLIASTGSIKSAADLLNNPAETKTIEIARRVDTSGTQASSNMFFLNAHTDGAQPPLTAVDFPIGDIATNGIGVTEGSSTGNVKTRLNSATQYVIGVISLENVPAGSDTYKFVAIDGASPNNAYDLTGNVVKADPFQRQNLASGSYQFGMESYVIYRDAAANTLASTLATLISDSTASNLVGYAYLDQVGTWAQWKSADGYVGNVNKQSRVSRGGSNLNPLKY